jgi:hypothetical protein
MHSIFQSIRSEQLFIAFGTVKKEVARQLQHEFYDDHHELMFNAMIIRFTINMTLISPSKF